MIVSKHKKAAVAVLLTLFLAACSDSVTVSNTDADTETDPTTGSETDTDTDTETDPGTDTETDTGTTSTTNVTTGNWVLNEDGERSINIFEEDSNTGVLVDVESVTEETIDGTTYVRVEASGVPSYQVTVDQELIDTLAARPRAATDFVNGSADIAIGDVVEFGANIGYNSSTEFCDTTGGSGYWPPGPGCPQDTDKSTLFTTTPVETAEECETGLGAIGYFSNGTSIYDWNDGQSYESAGIWQHTAANAEIHDLDICLGHSANSDYHHHNYSSCLAQELGDSGDGHSPVYGLSSDGFPIHGPWYASDTLAISSWVARDFDDATSASGCGVSGERNCLLVDQYDVSQGTVAASSNGPTTSESITSLSGNLIEAVSGLYFQDYYHDAALSALGGAYLDKHNGHRHDGLGYHYHMTIAENTEGSSVPAFPFTFGPTYKGELDDNALSSCAGATTSGMGGGTGGATGGGPGGGSPDAG